MAKFLQEYNILLKNVQGYLKTEVWQRLRDHGIFDAIQTNLSNSDPVVRHMCSDVLSSLMSNENAMVRDHILFQYNSTKESLLLNSFIKGITDETELGIQDNLSEAMRTLIDFEALQV